ncbi:MAG: class I SAM-dependent methyltransferase [bacterium]
MSGDERAIATTWARYWRSHGQEVGSWDSLSHTIYLALRREIGEARGKSILEAGCGSGRISARLAADGARVTCLDIAPEALELARRAFASDASVRFVQGSILSLPRDARYDVVWSSGLLEHFGPEDRRRALRESASMVGPGGLIVAFTPYARSVLYRLGKVVLERLGKWPYGREVPVVTLADDVPSTARLVREYTVAFLPLALDLYKWVRAARPVCLVCTRLLMRVAGDRGWARLDRALSFLLGGYLLVTVVAPRRSAEEDATSSRDASEGAAACCGRPEERHR